MPDTPNKPDERPSSGDSPNEANVLQRVISELSSLPQESRKRIIDTVCVFLGIGGQSQSSDSSDSSTNPARPQSRITSFQFSEAEEPSVKAFLHEKNPRTDVERVACLAYYLARHRAIPHVKTKDITELNKESAHRPFSNTADAVENATKLGYLVPSIKGCKQISAHGERFVEALPDRDAAREYMNAARVGRRTKFAKKSSGSTT